MDPCHLSSARTSPEERIQRGGLGQADPPTVDVYTLTLQQARLAGRCLGTRREGDTPSGTHDTMPWQGEFIRCGTQRKADQASTAGQTRTGGNSAVGGHLAHRQGTDHGVNGLQLRLWARWLDRLHERIVHHKMPADSPERRC